MELTILGSGTCIIKEQRSSASFLLRAGKTSLLLDCGWGAPEKLLKAGQDIQKLDHILISHPHADHIGSLINILQSMLVAGYDISGPGYQKRKRSKTLYLHGYKGFERDYEDLRRIEMPEREESYAIKLFEYYRKSSHTIGDLKITGVHVAHVPRFFNSAAFRIDYHGKSMTYGGDSCYDKAVIDLARNSDLALLEMSVPPSMFRKGQRPNHLSSYECGMMAKLAKVKTLALAHLYDNTASTEIIKEVRKNFDGELIITRDLQRIIINS